MTDAEYYDQVKAGIATAQAQQGRLDEATESFESAARMSPKEPRLAGSLDEMRSTAEALRRFVAERGLKDAARDGLCGTPCREVVDISSWNVCGATWADGCDEGQAPPEGFGRDATVEQLCAESCAFYSFQWSQVAAGGEAGEGGGELRGEQGVAAAADAVG